MRLKKIAFIFILLLLVLAGFYIYYSRQINRPPKNISARDFTIQAGENINQIAAHLQSAGLIKSVFLFKFYVRQVDAAKLLKAGDYHLSAPLSLRDLVALLAAGGEDKRETEIRFLEGWRIDDYAAYLADKKLPAAADFAVFAKTPISERPELREKYDFLADAPGAASLEGYLFPDTYKIFQSAGAVDLTVKMLDNFGLKLDEKIRADIARQGKTVFAIITMASLLEKEVRTEEDMKIVSGLFWQRIKNGQALESCATLAYALGINKKQYTYEDTRINSPYNTYTHQGLPPGPVANPGLRAIRAAVYPIETEYNYFLSRPDTGETVFSQTYAEHNRNKAKYLNP